MAKKNVVSIIYKGNADHLAQPCPSGKTYVFHRGEATDVAEKDAEWFLGADEVPRDFSEPEDEKEIPAPSEADFEEASEADLDLPLESADFGLSVTDEENN